MENKIEIYQGSDGQTQIEVKIEKETVWLSQEQLVELFQRDQSVKKFIAITKTSKATATRDLQHLQELGAFKQFGGKVGKV